MKIALITHFRKMPDSYSPGNALRAQVSMLQKYGHEPVVFTQEKSDAVLGCEVRSVVPHFKREKNVVNQEIKEKFKEILKKELIGFDIAITHDIMYIDDCITYREAIRECGVDIRWLHWARSGVGRKIDLSMPKAKYVYMNYKDIDRFASLISVSPTDIRVIFNTLDIRDFFDWHEISRRISEKIDLFNRDIVQVYPMCSTRMDAKGIDHVIKLFGKLKKLGNNVLLVIANANASRVGELIKAKIDYAKREGLTDDEILFTSTIGEDTLRQVPRRVIRDLMQIANLFIFPTISEVCSNVLLEASISKQLLVLNRDFPPLFDFGIDGKTCLGSNFGSLIQKSFQFRGEEQYMRLAKVIHQHLLQDKANQQFRMILKNHNIDKVYKNQLEPCLYENY